LKIAKSYVFLETARVGCFLSFITGVQYCCPDCFIDMFLLCSNSCSALSRIRERSIAYIHVSAYYERFVNVMSCANGCSVFCALLAIILVIFALQISSGNQTFAILAAEGNWDMSQKAQCCYNAAIGYAVLSFILFIYDRWRSSRGPKTKRRNVHRLVSHSPSPPRDSSPLLSSNRF
jgi:hypothetical protein